MDAPEERTGSMIMRAWLEDGRPDRLRVRILSSVGSRQAPPTAVSSEHAVHAAVDDWLRTLRTRPDNVPVTP
ncbi:hypothetical protein [Umezawaea sp.]|uniref:hypothetical protein n=1 Tax=Umezawaea sp. TaxID=1955258 RepID=UPI002ED6696A